MFFENPNYVSKKQFEEVQIGETISLKIDRQRIKDEGKTTLDQIVNILLNRFLILNVNGWEPAIQSYTNKSTPKFLLSNAEKCGILLEK